MAAEQALPVEGHGIGLDDIDRRHVSEHVAQRADEPVIDLHGGDGRARLGERQGQRPQPGADLDDAIAGPDAGEVGDAAHRVRVGDEVLPEIAVGAPGPGWSSSSRTVGRECVISRRGDVAAPRHEAH